MRVGVPAWGWECKCNFMAKIRVRDDRTLDWLVVNFGGVDLRDKNGVVCPPSRFSKKKYKKKPKKRIVELPQKVEVVRYSFKELSKQNKSYEEFNY